jgi:iron complex transport system permease protein
MAVAAVSTALVVLAAVLANPRALRASGGPSLTTGRAAAALVGRGDAVARTIVWRARVPRVLLAAACGAALAQAGALLQLLLRNPLADPFVLGVSSAAAFATVLGLALGVSFRGGGHPAIAGLGGLAAMLFVHRLSRGPGGVLATERMVLAGVVLSYLLSAGVMWIISLTPAEEGQRYLFWLMGSFSSASGGDGLLLGSVLALATLASLPLLPGLNLFALSEAHASDSGVPVERVKLGAFVIASVVTGASVAVAGSIGFVGLVVPHAVRLVTGSDARSSVPLAAFVGASFLVLADLVSRALGEIPVGVVTATCGAPFFLWLLAGRQGRSA